MLRITLWLLFVWDLASCSITCPDGNVCSDHSTCCLTKHGNSCCPHPNAVCCPDLAHCCPPDFRCNLVTQMCEKENQPWLNTPMVKKEAEEEPSPPVLSASLLQELKNSHVPDQNKSSVVHCDNYYTCPDGTTCCRHPKGPWSCCPYSSGHCCLDGYHCCPHGYDCDLTYTHCVRQSLRHPFTRKQALSSVPASLISPKEDEASPEEIENSNTPMVKKEAEEEPSPPVLSASPLQELKNSHVPDQNKSSVVHCDNYYTCPDGTTCCRHPKGPWSCCPYSSGHCCLDGYHCCPHGYDCDLTYTHCVRQSLRHPFTRKQALSSVPASLISPKEDEASPEEIENSNTPMVKKEAEEEPSPPVLSASLLQELKNSHVPDQNKSSVVHCDNYYTCPDGTTCCRHPKGPWSCCPYSSGHCCLDGYHCCPHGYDCDLTYTHCVRQSLRHPFTRKQALSSVPASLISPKEDEASPEEIENSNTPMVKKEAEEEPSPPVLSASPLQELKNSHVPDQNKSSVVHCDNYYTCPDGTTCCRHPKGPWSCCPYSSGHCCLDGYHCCPHGYDCDLTYTHCVRQSLRHPFTRKQALSSVPASLISPKEDEASPEETPMTALAEASGGAPKAGFIRCDSKFYCPQGKTCCKGPTGQWNCCPYPLGQCCMDGRHCCRYGYNCDPSSLSCVRFYSQVPSGTQEHATTD